MEQTWARRLNFSGPQHEGLLSTLTIPGTIDGVRDNCPSERLRTVFFRLGRRFGLFFLFFGKFSLTCVACGTARGGTQDASTQEDESQCVAAQGFLWLHITLPHLYVFSANRNWVLTGFVGFHRHVYCFVPGRFFFPASPRTAGGGTNHGQAG